MCITNRHLVEMFCADANATCSNREVKNTFSDITQETQTCDSSTKIVKHYVFYNTQCIL